MAFVTGAPSIFKNGTDGASFKSLSGIKPTVRVARTGRGVTAIRMMKDEKKAGWTQFNEQLNGRLAMMGFVIGILTEALAPSHPSVLQQLSALIEPVRNVLG
uniref:High light inducible protein n=1 Tax=Compsopogon caeruleus TaxID=31354 RepID=A0A7S1XF51_9RHOD|mmetsp:Transcript_3097/g.5927  ORF Transcript_3097/g.5927 Transcript_3097/m.5927 type:complete len:102 (+) Transcript_3097:57-362(+)|eukprot:CAMPEP_0184682028 /NCGR_PEP_ID=MMETSP0312-20130426/5489_1 /TAXON_ID=31354 /ORGANISM="Compsopogon coeruleus, Strain SAG 36.94" /LENGTH=101 /DNA_ID=CAMNT_0027133301 /DNA_START=24 /DNA_END=329 /DNA_ORIENTATION=-